MLLPTPPVPVDADREQGVWRALANPLRRRLLDLLGRGPRTTGDLADSVAEVSRFAVMQHVEVLVAAGLVTVRRRGRQRFNHLNPVPLREWYLRWVSPLADMAATEMLSLRRHLEGEAGEMTEEADIVRTVRIVTELRFRAAPQRVFDALTRESLEWFPHTWGGSRVKGIVVEPRVGGAFYEDWGEGRGHLYAHVTAYDPPNRLATRGWVFPGSILDTDYTITAQGGETLLSMSKVAVGPMSADEARSVRTHGDLASFEDALRRWIERP